MVMATTKQRAKQPSPNGKAATAGAVVKDVGDTAATVARRARGPLLAAGAAAAGLAGGLAAGSRLGAKRRGRGWLLAPRRRVLGVPLGPKSGARRAVEMLRDGAKHFDSATSQMSGTTEDVRQIREQLEKANRQSPLEVVLDGLTHRRGAHKRES
jgi:hypothetical protein